MMEKQPQGTSLAGLYPKPLCHEKFLSPSTCRLVSSNYPSSLFIERWGRGGGERGVYSSETHNPPFMSPGSRLSHISKGVLPQPEALGSPQSVPLTNTLLLIRRDFDMQFAKLVFIIYCRILLGGSSLKAGTKTIYLYVR